MMTSRPFGLGLAVLFGLALAACSSDPAVGSKPETDPQMSKLVSIRVAGFVEAAGIT